MVFPEGKNKNSLKQQKEQRTQMKPLIAWEVMTSEKQVQENGGDKRDFSRLKEGQGSLVCCSPWGLKEWNTTWLKNNKRKEGENKWQQPMQTVFQKHIQ